MKVGRRAATEAASRQIGSGISCQGRSCDGPLAPANRGEQAENAAGDPKGEFDQPLLTGFGLPACLRKRGPLKLKWIRLSFL